MTNLTVSQKCSEPSCKTYWLRHRASELVLKALSSYVGSCMCHTAGIRCTREQNRCPCGLCQYVMCRGRTTAGFGIFLCSGARCPLLHLYQQCGLHQLLVSDLHLHVFSTQSGVFQIAVIDNCVRVHEEQTPVGPSIHFA